MALKGTLADLGIIDLIQLLHVGRKSGKFVIGFDNGEASLYYDKGTLVHAEVGEKSGLDALVFVVGMERGSFEFYNDEAAPLTTIHMDLHHAVMQALKLHDEQKAAAAQSLDAAPTTQQGTEAMFEALSAYISSSDFALHACVLNSDGSLLASADGPDGAIEGSEQVRGLLHAFVADYPRPNVDRLFVVDELGTVVLAHLPPDRSLMVMAAREAPLGVVSLSVNRLVSSLP